jgi:hypothetical protein
VAAGIIAGFHRKRSWRKDGVQLRRWRRQSYTLLVARRVAECSDFQRKSLWDLALMLGSIFTRAGFGCRNAPAGTRKPTDAPPVRVYPHSNSGGHHALRSLRACHPGSVRQPHMWQNGKTLDFEDIRLYRETGSGLKSVSPPPPFFLAMWRNTLVSLSAIKSQRGRAATK